MFSGENASVVNGFGRPLRKKMVMIVWLIRVSLTDSRRQSENGRHQNNRGNVKRIYSQLINSKRTEPIRGGGGQKR